MPHLLIIEDEPKVLRSLKNGLQAEGYEITPAATGDAGYEQACSGRYDGIVLDLMLPGRSGLQILAGLRRRGRTTPVLVLTARDSIEDRVVGLDAGADDYLVKPFAFAELLARVRALLRRGQAERETILKCGDLEMDLLLRRATCNGTEILLTPREFEVLEYLARHKNLVVTRDMLSREVWKESDQTPTNVIDVYINYLRRKLEKHGRRDAIQTVRGVGFCLRE